MRAIENAAVMDIYADGIERLDICGPNIRIVYFTWDNGQKIITAKVIRPLVTFNLMLEKLVNEAKARNAGFVNFEQTLAH
jgi:hypothetical protein